MKYNPNRIRNRIIAGAIALSIPALFYADYINSKRAADTIRENVKTLYNQSLENPSDRYKLLKKACKEIEEFEKLRNQGGIFLYDTSKLKEIDENIKEKLKAIKN